MFQEIVVSAASLSTPANNADAGDLERPGVMLLVCPEERFGKPFPAPPKYGVAWTRRAPRFRGRARWYMQLALA
jgi:hypothetical protein